MLSGGERQRPRILLQHAPIMILDEATANLDCVTERAVTQTLNSISAGKKLTTITHRLKAMEQYDRILFVLEKGKMVKQGLHGELMDGDRLYRRMWELQHVVKVGK